jgi:GTPase SAR1 family protein
MTHVYYKNSDFCLIMFDLMNRKSFESCAKWKLDLDEKYSFYDGSKCPCLLIGNKVIPNLNNIVFIFENCSKA